MTYSSRPSSRLAGLAADLADLLASRPPTPPPPSSDELLRRILDDRDTIGELAGAVNRLEDRVAELEELIGTAARNAESIRATIEGRNRDAA